MQLFLECDTWLKWRIPHINSYQSFAISALSALTLCVAALGFLVTAVCANKFLARIDEQIQRQNGTDGGRPALRRLMKRVGASGAMLLAITFCALLSTQALYNPLGYLVLVTITQLLFICNSLLGIASFAPPGKVQTGPFTEALVQVRRTSRVSLLRRESRVATKEYHNTDLFLRGLRASSSVAKTRKERRRSISDRVSEKLNNTSGSLKRLNRRTSVGDDTQASESTNFTPKAMDPSGSLASAPLEHARGLLMDSSTSRASAQIQFEPKPNADSPSSRVSAPDRFQSKSTGDSPSSRARVPVDSESKPKAASEKMSWREPKKGSSHRVSWSASLAKRFSIKDQVAPTPSVSSMNPQDELHPSERVGVSIRVLESLLRICGDEIGDKNTGTVCEEVRDAKGMLVRLLAQL